MAQVNTSLPCRLVYAINENPHIGYVVEPYMVELTTAGDYSFTYQKLSNVTVKDFVQFIQPDDVEIIRELEKIALDNIVKKYHSKPVTTKLFFEKFYLPQVQQLARDFTSRTMDKVLPLLLNKALFYKGKDGNPCQHKVVYEEGLATVVFHFIRSEQNMRYYPTIKLNENKVEFIAKNSRLITESPAYLLINNAQLIRFEEHVDGKKIKIFLDKRYLEIPRSAEDAYFQKFVIPLAEQYHIHAQGFTVKTEQHQASPVIKIETTWNGNLQLLLYFNYGEEQYAFSQGKKISATFSKTNDDITLVRTKRNAEWERNKAKRLIDLGLKNIESAAFVVDELKTLTPSTEINYTKYQLVEWLSAHSEPLKADNFTIEQAEFETEYLIAKPYLSIKISESKDWFDVHAIVMFGDIEIPFASLRNNIIHNKREYTLPNGQVVIIPEQWFAQLRDLFSLTDENTANKNIQLKKYHIGILQQLQEGNIAEVVMNRKLQQLLTMENIEETELPKQLNATLRPYQKAGFDWMCFLHSYGFGGCLADDMGLGKTLQTLSLLAKMKEMQQENPIALEDVAYHQRQATTSLLIAPTSLLYNWKDEAKKFTPQLKIYIHAGADRVKNADTFVNYDLIITSYGMARNDLEVFNQFYFNYVILDESQYIKNYSSQVSQNVFELKSAHKLILSGTPLENSISELWTQMHFINKGLLGSYGKFKDNYVTPIEKENDIARTERLHSIIKPFVMRRTKKQVATDLPDKIEQVVYCDMSEKQAELYEETKSQYRNELIGANGEVNKGKSMNLLAGLTKLRQISNHPSMVMEDYDGDSGKFDEVILRLQNALNEGHKVLIFSQFVKQLKLFQDYLTENATPYFYIDGSVKSAERKSLVDQFQASDDVKVFLISLKAGGVGLNLTTADYVFILDPWWNPATERQAVDRAHRIGQLNTVFTYKFISKNSVEEKIVKLQEHKQQLSDSLIKTEESFFKSLSKEDIQAILA
jgi:hypothetical protein